MTSDDQKRAALEEHWQASERRDSAVEHGIYSTDAILDYPQSGERFQGRGAISNSAVPILPIDTSPCSGSSEGAMSG